MLLGPKGNKESQSDELKRKKKEFFSLKQGEGHANPNWKEKNIVK